MPPTEVKLKKLYSAAQIEQTIRQEEKNIFGFFIKHYRFTYLILIAVLAMGLYAVVTMPRESDPEIEVPYASVTVVYPGATPTDIEQLVTKPLEDRIKNVEKIKLYRSSSGAGVASVFVEFEADADITESVNKLKTAVDLAKAELPDDAEDPVVAELNISDQSLITYSLVGEGFSDTELKAYAELLQDRLEGIAGISRVSVIGGLTREFRVVVDQNRLAGFNLSLGQVVSAITRANVNLPAGNIEIDGFNYNVRVEGKFADISGLREVVVAVVNATPVYLRDIARITDTYKERASESFIGVAGQASNPTVSLLIFKRTGGNILNIVDESKAIVAGIRQEPVWPKNLTVAATNDFSVFIRDDLRILGRSGAQTMLLIILILMLAVGLRAAVITSLSVPIAFLAAFVVLMWQDMTLNGMVLFSLVLSLGLMVDNSIVIIEGIAEYMGKYGLSSYQAGLLSVWNYRWPIISGTMTTVAAFAPMFLVSGILGEYLSIIPITLMATLLSSLAVALVVIPVLASKLIRSGGHAAQEYANGDAAAHNAQTGVWHAVSGWFHRRLHALREVYARVITRIVSRKKTRRWTIAAAWLAFLLAASFPVLGFMKIEMFPKVDVDFIFVNMELPVGSTLDKTRALAQEVEQIVAARVPEATSYVTNVGSTASIGTESGGSGSHMASVTINLREERERKSFEISESLRPYTDAVQGAAVTVEELSAGPPTGAPIEVRIYGDELKQIILASQQVKQTLAAIDGVINIIDNLEDATGEFTFTIDSERARYYGLDVAAVAGTLRNAIYGTTASEALIDGDDVDITVAYADEAYASVNDLENTLLVTPQGVTPLKNVASVSIQPSLLAISHRDGKSTVSVQADITPATNLQTILTAFDEQRAAMQLPKGVSIEVGGEVEDIDQSFRETFLSMIVAVILIAMILVLQFNSFKQPFIIIFSLPLAIPGVIIGLTILGQPFSFPAFIGIVALTGIVVNDAIVLVDKVNKNVKAIPADGRTMNAFYEAVIDGGVARLQPILLTSLTTIAGILPLYFANEVWRGLSVTVAAGLALSTLLTLIVVPCMYVALTRKDFMKGKI